MALSAQEHFWEEYVKRAKWTRPADEGVYLKFFQDVWGEVPRVEAGLQAAATWTWTFWQAFRAKKMNYNDLKTFEETLLQDLTQNTQNAGTANIAVKFALLDALGILGVQLVQYESQTPNADVFAQQLRSLMDRMRLALKSEYQELAGKPKPPRDFLTWLYHVLLLDTQLPSQAAAAAVAPAAVAAASRALSPTQGPPAAAAAPAVPADSLSTLRRELRSFYNETSSHKKTPGSKDRKEKLIGLRKLIYIASWNVPLEETKAFSKQILGFRDDFPEFQNRFDALDNLVR
jgi:hypothetical protein